MKKLKKEFTKLEEEYLSSYIRLAIAIKNSNFSYKTIRKNFNKFVEKEDYSESEKRQLLKHLDSLRKRSEEEQYCTKNQF